MADLTSNNNQSIENGWYIARQYVRSDLFTEPSPIYFHCGNPYNPLWTHPNSTLYLCGLLFVN